MVNTFHFFFYTSMYIQVRVELRNAHVPCRSTGAIPTPVHSNVKLMPACILLMLKKILRKYSLMYPNETVFSDSLLRSYMIFIIM